MEAFLLRNIILLDESGYISEVSFLPRAAGSCENIGLNEFNLEFPITSNIALHCQHIYSQSTKSQKKAGFFGEVEFLYFLNSLLSNCLSDNYFIPTWGISNRFPPSRLSQ